MEYVRHVCQRSNRCPSRPLQEKAYVCRTCAAVCQCVPRVPHACQLYKKKITTTTMKSKK